jgi:HSP20 family protein
MPKTNVATQENQSVRNQSAHEQTQRQDRRGWIQPQVNIAENQDGYILEAEMPGVSKDGLEVLLEGNEITIVGRRGNCPDGADCLYRESYDRDYRRTFELDPAIDTTRISARMDNGVLYLELPKSERVKPRKISVD